MTQLHSLVPAADAVIALDHRQAARVDLRLAQWRAAAEGGDEDAMFDLAVALSTGASGLPRDLVEAHKWFNLAAANGHDEAHLSRAEIAGELTDREIAQAQRRARAWLTRTARQAV